MKYTILISALFLICATTSAQEHPMLDSWRIAAVENGSLLEWNIISGNTCQGIRIYRSQNGLDFEEIGRITGVCGSISEPVPYTWQDFDPVELSTNYYRIEMGTQGFSSVKNVEIDLVGNTSLVYPNPASSNAVLIFRTSGNEAQEVLIFNAMGKLVHQESGSGNNTISIDPGLAPGSYFYTISSTSNSYSGRFIVL